MEPVAIVPVSTEMIFIGRDAIYARRERAKEIPYNVHLERSEFPKKQERTARESSPS